MCSVLYNSISIIIAIIIAKFYHVGRSLGGLRINTGQVQTYYDVFYEGTQIQSGLQLC